MKRRREWHKAQILDCKQLQTVSSTRNKLYTSGRQKSAEEKAHRHLCSFYFPVREVSGRISCTIFGNLVILGNTGHLNKSSVIGSVDMQPFLTPWPKDRGGPRCHEWHHRRCKLKRLDQIALAHNPCLQTTFPHKRGIKTTYLRDDRKTS